MMEYSTSTQYLLDVTKRLLAVDSPTGFTNAVSETACKEFADLGLKAEITRKGCLLCDLGGEGKPLIVTAHLDTLGGIVAEV